MNHLALNHFTKQVRNQLKQYWIGYAHDLLIIRERKQGKLEFREFSSARVQSACLSTFSGVMSVPQVLAAT